MLRPLHNNLVLEKCLVASVTRPDRHAAAFLDNVVVLTSRRNEAYLKGKIICGGWKFYTCFGL